MNPFNRTTLFVLGVNLQLGIKTLKLVLYLLAVSLLFVFGQVVYADQPAQEFSNQRKPLHIQIGYPVATLLNGQIGQVLEHTNILELNGLEADIASFAYGAPTMEALVAGKIDIAFTTEGPASLLLSKNVPAEIIATLGTFRSSLLVLPNSPIKKVVDLEGRTIAVPFGSTPHMHLLHWLRDAGLDANEDVSIVNLGTGEMEAAFVSGSVDAIVFWEPNITQLIKKLNAEVIAEDKLQSVLIVRRSFLSSNYETVRQFLVAVRESALYMATHQEQVDTWFSDASRVDPDVVHEASLHSSTYVEDKALADVNLEITPEVLNILRETSEFLVDQGFADKLINVNQVVNHELWKSSLSSIEEDTYNPKRVKVTRK